MGYILKREDGELLVEFELKQHHQPACRAEGRNHDLTNETLMVIWYQDGERWMILATGPNAERILNTSAKGALDGNANY